MHDSMEMSSKTLNIDDKFEEGKDDSNNDYDHTNTNIENSGKYYSL